MKDGSEPPLAPSWMLRRWELGRYTREEKKFLSKANKFAGPRASAPSSSFADFTRYFLARP